MLYNVDDINGKTDKQLMPKSIRPRPIQVNSSLFGPLASIYLSRQLRKLVMTGMLGLNERVELVHGGLKNVNTM